MIKGFYKVYAVLYYMLDQYICRICGEVYLSQDLKKTRESRPPESLVMELGSLFRFDDGLFGILYDSEIVRQTHHRNYLMARTYGYILV